MIKNDSQNTFALAKAGGSRGAVKSTRDMGASPTNGERGRGASTTGLTQGSQEIAARQHGEVAPLTGSTRRRDNPDGTFKISAPDPVTPLGRDIDQFRRAAGAMRDKK